MKKLFRYLYPDRSKVTKQKSPLLKLGADPNWNHCFVYDDVTVEDLRERCLELTVWAHHRVGTNEFLGGIRLNFGIGKYFEHLLMLHQIWYVCISIDSIRIFRICGRTKSGLDGQ